MTTKWWQNSVVYQIYPRSFNDSNQDGVGDIPGIIQKLDYLSDLGIDVIWLSPVYASPMKDNGYDISDYENIAEVFGTMEDMDQLIAEGKKRGISIIMDLVINHSSDQHPWFQESRRSKDNPKRDFYIWQDPREDGGPPNNLRAVFGGSCWEYDERTGQYYFHSFAKEQPDLNWENPELREHLYKMVRWWLDKGIGGFRIDAITFIKKQPFYDDFTPDGPDGLQEVAPNQPGVGEFLQELKRETFDHYDIFTVAEAPGVEPEEIPDFVGEDGHFDMLIRFDHVDIDIGPHGRWFPTKDWKLQDFKQAITNAQKATESDGWMANYLENHDQPRAISRFIPQEDQSEFTGKMLATTYFFLKGTPYIYQGQEIGMLNTDFQSIDELDDISSIDQYEAALRHGHTKEDAFRWISHRSRDNARTPMHWNATYASGFSEAAPWLKVSRDYEEINVAEAESRPDSLFQYYKYLIYLRHNSSYSSVLISGDYEEQFANHKQVFVYTRTLENERVIILANFTNEEAELTFDTHLGTWIFGNLDSTCVNGKEVKLRPYETAVVEWPK
ncbi:glycoside hydrolase family 13 protein [Salsuginibacillus kocurii]|uniref:glycoside hydrolase family 13 protein n=1 Tax=Salsuginibacillus kocurii TaxID=427078 RepID=UPI00036BCC14|nr:alpha-glucosidase [Salsuginibacillus kocurii]